MHISLGELKDNKDRVTSVIFKKDEYTLEGIIRWLLDRNFNFDKFSETEKYYVFEQPNPSSYTGFEYKIIEGQNIGVELGVSKEKGSSDKIHLDEIFNL